MKKVILWILFISTAAYAGKFFSDLTIQGDLLATGTADIGNIKINTNTISSENTDGPIVLTPNGTGLLTTDNLTLGTNTISTSSGKLILNSATTEVEVPVGSLLQVDNGLQLNANILTSQLNNANIQIDAPGASGRISILDPTTLGGSSAHTDAVLALESDTRAFLITSLTTTERDNISTPTAGLMTFNETTNELNLYNGTAWGSVAGGGGGSGGLNILDNPDANSGILNWTGVNGTVTRETGSPLEGAGSFILTTDGGSSAAQSNADAVTIPSVLKGKNCLIKIDYQTTYAAFDLIVWDGAAKIISETLPVNASPQTQTKKFTFVCPDSGSLTYRIEDPTNSGANVITYDLAYLGENDGTIEISQAQIVAKAYYDTTTNCVWARTNTALGAFATDADCPAITSEFTTSPITVDLTDDDLPTYKLADLPTGRYEVTANFHANSNTSGDAVAFTINDGATTNGRASCSSVTSQACNIHLKAVFDYTTGQATKTFAINGSSLSGEVRIILNQANERVEWVVKRYPLESELAIDPGVNPSFWSGSHDSDCSWSATQTSYANYPNDGSCTLTEKQNVNFGSVSTLGASRPGVSFSVINAGYYKVCAYFSVGVDIALENMGFRLIDDAAVVLDEGSRRSYNSTSESIGPRASLCGKMKVNSVATKTVELQVKSGSGASLLSSFFGASVQWEIERISEGMTAPLLVNSVVSPYNGVTKTASMMFAGASTVTDCTGSPCTQYQEFGDWVDTVTRSGAGTYVVTLKSAAFSEIPNCWCNGYSNTFGVVNCSLDGPSLSSFNLYTMDSGGTLRDSKVMLKCEGPK